MLGCWCWYEEKKENCRKIFSGPNVKFRDAFNFSNIVDGAATLAKTVSRARAFLTSHVS